jgi:HD-GYP domain-containing protein (c-di-GMP phosphodiesterase class II)
MEARDFITDGHADRLQDIVADMGDSLGLTASTISDLRLLARFHDIGKVGVPDHILFKSGKLTTEEYTIMQRHSEIGYRIAQSSPDLTPIADWILKHHERWDGQGYPLGLAADDIPLACRILGIADAYDAMTNDRPYRQAMTCQEAIAEIRHCSGSQFDPQLVEIFITIIENN